MDTQKFQPVSRLRYYIIALFGIFTVFFLLAGFTDVNAGLSKVWLTQNPLQKADALVILGGGINAKTGEMSIKTEERTLSGAELFKNDVAPIVIVAGGKVGKNPYPEAPAMAELLMLKGVPFESIVQEDQSENTWENAQNVIAITRANNWKKLIVLTSDFHTYRACKFFREQGVDIICRSADRNVINQHTFKRRILGSKAVLREFAANCYYWLKGK